MFATSTHVICASPVDYVNTTATVEVSMNNQDFTSSSIIFQYQGMHCAGCVFEVF